MAKKRANQQRGDHSGRVTPKGTRPSRRIPELAADKFLNGRMAPSSPLQHKEDDDQDPYSQFFAAQTGELKDSTTMDSSLLPGAFDNTITVLREELDTYCPGLSDAFESLSTQGYPAIEQYVFDEFVSHMQKQERLLRGVVERKLDRYFGPKGLVIAPDWFEGHIPSPTQVLHSIGAPRSMQHDHLLDEFSDIVATYKARCVEILDLELGLSYDEDKVAEMLSKFIISTREDRTAEIKSLFDEALEHLWTREIDMGDHTRLECGAKDMAMLAVKLQKIKRILGRMNRDFLGWYFQDIDSFLDKNFYFTNEMVDDSLQKNLEPLFPELLHDIEAFVSRHREKLEGLSIEELTDDASEKSETVADVSPIADFVETRPDSVHNLELLLPWMGDSPVRRTVAIYDVPGYGKVGVCSAIAPSNAEITVDSAESLTDPDAFNLLVAKAVNGVAAGKRYLPLMKGGPVTPYDEFTLAAEEGGSGGDAARMYFVRTTLDRVATVPSAPRIPVVIVVAKTNKKNQPKVLLNITGQYNPGK